MNRTITTTRLHRRLTAPTALASMFCTLAACGSGTSALGPEPTGTSTSALVTGHPGSVNGDSTSDIALVGGVGWDTLPVAFSLGNGSFNVTNTVIGGNFGQLGAQAGALPVTGDFNGDGLTDVALVGGYDASGSPATGIPVAFSNGDGSFRVTNFSAGLFPQYAIQGAVKPLAGDFNGDGLWDIALTGGFLPGTLTPWNTIPIAFSNGDGTFRIVNGADADFASRATNDGAKAVSGDFDGDGKTDIALTGGLQPGTSTPWTNIPIAFSNGDGTFRNTLTAVDFFPVVARQTGAVPVSGDFDGDGKTDIALTGGFIPGTTTPWNTIPVAFSNGDGSFRVTNDRVAGFPLFATTPGAQVVAGDFNGDGRGDIALTGVNGWATIPVAFSGGDGSFSVTDSSVANFPGFAAQPHVRVAGAWSSAGNAGDPAAFASAVLANIRTTLSGKVVGYSATFGGKADSAGNARTQIDAPAQSYTDQTKMPVASVSKVVTALAAIRILASHNISLDAAIGPYVPSDWTLDPHVAAITFRQLLSHTSGIKDYGNVSQDYASMKAFFTQTVDPTKNSLCTGPTVISPPNPFNTIDRSPCYSNWNFAIFRVLLPEINGFADNPANRAALIAAAYIQIVQNNVFAPVGVVGVDAKPPVSGPQATAYAFSYLAPGTTRGFNWGDDTLIVGAAGWYLSVDDITPVLVSLSRDDGKILTDAQLTDMETFPLGWDIKQDSSGFRAIEKNGGWAAGATSLSTSIALFGPGVPGSLFINSDIMGNNIGAAAVLDQAYLKALTDLK